MSFSIRRIRFNTHRVKAIEKSVATNNGDSAITISSIPEKQSQSGQPLSTNSEPAYFPKESYRVDAEIEPEYTGASDSDEDSFWDDYFETKSFKDDFARAKGSKGLQKISLADYENFYLTGDGELWYVIEQPDGKTGKMQVQIDEDTSEITIIDGGYAKADGSQGLQRISVGEYADLYLTGENELWYVSKQPDGSIAKMQLLTEDIDGEVAIVGSGEMNVYPADGDKSSED